MLHILAATLALLAPPSSGLEACSSLKVWNLPDPVKPVQTVILDVQGVQPFGLVYALSGAKPGSTLLNLRKLGTIEVGLLQPFTTTYLGVADAKGHFRLSSKIPSDIGLTLHVQAAGFKLISSRDAPRAEFCPSNVVLLEL